MFQVIGLLAALNVLLTVVLVGAVKRSRELAVLAAEADSERRKALGLAEKEHRRASEQFSVIEDVIKERETWKRLYQRMALGSGAAQQWLFRELGRVLGELNEYRRAAGKPLTQVDPGLRDLVEQFRPDEATLPPPAETKPAEPAELATSRVA